MLQTVHAQRNPITMFYEAIYDSLDGLVSNPSSTRSELACRLRQLTTKLSAPPINHPHLPLLQLDSRPISFSAISGVSLLA